MPSDLLRNLLFGFVLFVAPSALAAERAVPGRLPTGETLLPNGRLLTPTGTQTQVAPYPFAVALTPDGSRVVVACSGADDQSLHLLDAATGTELAKEPVRKSWLGLAIAPDGAHAYLAGAGGRNVLVFGLERDRFVPEEPISLRRSADAPAADATPAGLAVSADGKSLWAARILLNDVVRVDLVSRAVVAAVSRRRPPLPAGPLAGRKAPRGRELGRRHGDARRRRVRRRRRDREDGRPPVGPRLRARRPDALRRAVEPEPRRGRGRRVAVRGAADLGRARTGRTRHALGRRPPGRLDAERARALAGRADALRRERRRRRGRGRRRRAATSARHGRRGSSRPAGIRPRSRSRRTEGRSGSRTPRACRPGRTRWAGPNRGRRTRDGLEEDPHDPGLRVAGRRAHPAGAGRAHGPGVREPAPGRPRSRPGEGLRRRPGGAGRRLADQARRLRDPREPHVRPGPRRPPAGQRRSRRS